MEVRFLYGSERMDFKPNFANYSGLIHRAISNAQPGSPKIDIRFPESIPVNKEVLVKIYQFLETLSKISTAQRQKSNTGTTIGNKGIDIIEKLTQENKKKLYEYTTLKGLGEALPLLILCGDFFEVVHDYLIKAIRKCFEKDLESCFNTVNSNSYFQCKDSFSDAVLNEINLESPFDSTKIYRNGLLYNSLPDIKRLQEEEKMNNNNNNIHSDIVKALLPRKPETSVTISPTNCHRCKSVISHYLLSFYYESRHHCRDCGLIFCSQCSSESVESTDLKKQRYHGYLDSFHTKKRVCIDCAKTIKDSNHHKDLVRMLDILALRFGVLRRFAATCPKWREAAILYLSNIRMIQYSFPTHKFQPHEQKVLWRNRSWLQSHSIWTIKLLISIDYESISPEKLDKFCNEFLKDTPPTEERPVDCYYLMCSSSCSKDINALHAVPLLDHQITNPKIRGFAVKKLENLGEDLLLLLPQLVFLLRYEVNGISDFSEFLFRKAKESSNIAYGLLWELKNCQKSSQYELRYEFLKSELIRQLSQHNPEQTRSYILGFELPYILQQHPLSSVPDLKYLEALKIFESTTEKIRFPGDPDYFIESFNIKETKIIVSATQPMRISCNCVHSKTGEKKKLPLMFKKDDVRKDQIILNLISIMSRLLQNPPKPSTVNLIPPVTYRVQPTGCDYGFIQMVQDSTTLKDINCGEATKKVGTFLGGCGQHAEEIFTTSLATWIIITHLLGVGDRHNENVMLTKTGQIFHIDYGFILGREPKPISNYIRFDKGFDDILNTDQKIKAFHNTCVEVFNILRKESHFFLYHLLFLTRFDPPIGGHLYEKYIEEEVASRFLPGVTDQDAASFVRYLLTSNFDSNTQNFVDFLRARKIQTTQTLNEIKSSVNFYSFNEFFTWWK